MLYDWTLCKLKKMFKEKEEILIKFLMAFKKLVESLNDLKQNFEWS